MTKTETTRAALRMAFAKAAAPMHRDDGGDLIMTAHERALQIEAIAIFASEKIRDPHSSAFVQEEKPYRAAATPKERTKATKILRRVHRWAGRNAFDKHVSKADLTWLSAYHRRTILAKIKGGRASAADKAWWLAYGVVTKKARRK